MYVKAAEAEHSYDTKYSAGVLQCGTSDMSQIDLNRNTLADTCQYLY